MTLYELQRPLRANFIGCKICVFIMKIFIEIFIKIGLYMNEYARKNSSKIPEHGVFMWDVEERSL